MAEIRKFTPVGLDKVTCNESCIIHGLLSLRAQYEERVNVCTAEGSPPIKGRSSPKDYLKDRRVCVFKTPETL